MKYLNVIVIKGFVDKPYRLKEREFTEKQVFSVLYPKRDTDDFYELGPYRIPKANVVPYNHDKSEHFCSIKQYPGLKIKYNNMHVFPVVECYEENGELWVSNHERFSAMQVNFCPFCGWSVPCRKRIEKIKQEV